MNPIDPVNAQTLGDYVARQFDWEKDGNDISCLLAAMRLLAIAGHQGCRERVEQHEESCRRRAGIVK